MSMYNLPIKEEYIDQCMNSSRATDVKLQYQKLKNFFNRLGKIEKAFNVDIADADYETAILILNQMGEGGARNDSNILAMCKQYIDWSINNGYTKNFENKLDGVTVKDLDKSATYRMTMIKNEQELVDCLDACLSNINSNSIDMVLRVYVVLIFSGVEPKLAPTLLLDSVDLLKKTVCVNDILINLSDVACMYISILSKVKSFITIRGRSGTYNISKANTGYLLENSSDNRSNLMVYLRSALSKASNAYYDATHTKKSLNSNCIYKSGVFYRAWAKECAGEEVSLDEYFQFKKTSAAVIRSKLLVEYQTWKKAFSL